MFRPPIPVARTVIFADVPLGTKVRNKAAFVVWPPALFGSATDTFNVSAHIENDADGLFRVVGIALADLVADPDTRPPVFSWEIGPMTDGAGPVPVDVGEAILVMVEFSCPSDPSHDLFSAVVVLDGLRRKVTLPITATTNAKLTCMLQIDKQATLGIGVTKAFAFSISSTLGHDAEATLQYDSTFSPLFASSTILVRIPKGGTANGFITITNLAAKSIVSHPYPVRFVVAETNGGHSSATTGVIIGASVQQNAPAVDIDLMEAAEQLHQFWASNGGLITVGLPIGPAIRDQSSGFLLPCATGTLKIESGGGTPAKPQTVDRVLVDSVQIIGCRCFASDDPNEDETYVVASFGWFSFDEKTKQTIPQSMTIRTPIIENTKGDDGGRPGSVILADFPLATSMVLPGDTSIAMHLDLWDHESGDADDIRDQASAVAQDAMAVAAGIVTGLLAGLGAGVAAGLASKVSGLLSSVGDAIGDLVKGLFDDDHIDSKDLPIDSTYVQRLIGTFDPKTGHVFDAEGNDLGTPVLDRTSDSLEDHTRTYNFPERVEDDTPEGQSWLFDAGSGGGTYRIFFKVTASRVGKPSS